MWQEITTLRRRATSTTCARALPCSLCALDVLTACSLRSHVERMKGVLSQGVDLALPPTIKPGASLHVWFGDEGAGEGWQVKQVAAAEARGLLG